MFEEEWSREEKPENPDHDYLFKMILMVHFRQKFKPEEEDSLHFMGGFIEQDLRSHEIDFQELKIKDNEQTVHILCNDPEEREHIRHLLLAN